MFDFFQKLTIEHCKSIVKRMVPLPFLFHISIPKKYKYSRQQHPYL